MGHSKRNILQEMNMTRPSQRLKVPSTRYWKVHRLCFTYSKRKEHSCIRKKWQRWAMENNELLSETPYVLFEIYQLSIYAFECNIMEHKYSYSLLHLNIMHF